MEKITFEEMVKKMLEHGETHSNNDDWNDSITAVIVFKKENWPNHNYSVLERSYRVSSYNRCFQRGKISTSMYGDCLDGVDVDVRLDLYEWEPEYCYFEG